MYCRIKAQIFPVRYVIPLSLSDHDCIVCVQKINHKETPPREIIYQNYGHYDPIAFNNNLRNFGWSPLYSCSNVNDASNILEQNLTITMNNHVPKIKKKNERKVLSMAID